MPDSIRKLQSRKQNSPFSNEKQTLKQSSKICKISLQAAHQQIKSRSKERHSRKKTSNHNEEKQTKLERNAAKNQKTRVTKQK